jgi:kynurenine formamidase
MDNFAYLAAVLSLFFLFACLPLTIRDTGGSPVCAVAIVR